MDSDKNGPLILRVTDQETARVVAVHDPDGCIVGAGCLVDSGHVLTCRHVLEAALSTDVLADRKTVAVSLAGVTTQPTVEATIMSFGASGIENDLALLKILNEPNLKIPPVEFASPLRHGGKAYSVLGFPGGDQQGRNVVGQLHAADSKGLVQMDRGGALSVLGGFSGAPVWSPDLNAFVGLVVTELADDDVSWCIPSRRICEFYPDLLVRFRVPPSDRPQINDFKVDDPNVQMFGEINDDGARRLTVTVQKNTNEDIDEDFIAHATYECLPNSLPPRGGFVTFITHPSYTSELEDAYELFDRLDKDGKAKAVFYPEESFSLAAIGDAGSTVLTFDLKQARPKARGFK